MIPRYSRFKKFIIAVFFIFFFLVNLSFSATRCVWTGVDKIVAVGDLHGSFDGFVKILKSTNIIDDKMHWIGGETHLVQMGDVLDRGKDAKKIFDLLMRLEKEAEAAGGHVHVLIGNHEEMNILGLAFGFTGYVTVGQFVSFLPEKYRNKMEKDIRQKFAEEQPDTYSQGNSLQEALQTFWAETMNESTAQEFYHENFMKEYGRWILTKNIAIKLNNIIFVHGGINKKFSEWGIIDINETMRRELSFLSRGVSINRTIVYQPDSPVWFRDFARGDEEELKEDLNYVLQNLNADYMVIGHTVTAVVDFSPKSLSRFDGRVWTIDTGISEFYRGALSALIIQDGKFQVWGEFE
jgi:hypothetical protein